MASPHKEERAILEALRHGTAPSIIKRQASRGNVPVAAGEMLEILVFLTQDPDPTCSEEAQRTLASWPEEKCSELLAAPDTSAEVLAWFARRENVSDAMVRLIADHPNAGDDALAALAGRLSLLQVRKLAGHPERFATLLHFAAALLERPDLPVDLRPLCEKVQAESSPPRSVEELEAALSREEEHEAQASPEEKRERMSVTQKIARMSVGERVQLALKGGKDERLILIRDPSKVVYRAVLQSPKLTDSEVESFATMKNVADEVLRLLSSNRKFVKNHVVIRNLVNNPRTPIDVSLTMLNHLTEHELKFLTRNRNVPETVRTMAVKLFQQRSSGRRGG